MESEKKGLAQPQEGESCEKLLEKLGEQLQSSNASVRRQAAFALSWMQEDGLGILRDTIFGDSPVSTKNAAAYGLRKMRGRMKKLALEVFDEGLNQDSSSTIKVCSHAIEVMQGGNAKAKKKKAPAKSRIQDISANRKRPKKPVLEETNWNRR